MLLITVPTTAYEKLTETEAENWLKSITMDELVEFVILYDYVEHAKPDINLPEYRVIQTDEMLILDPADKMRISIGHLKYDVTLSERTVDWEPPEQKSCFWPVVIGGGVGLGLGVIGGLIIGAVIR
jgi:hypothetical protein